MRIATRLGRALRAIDRVLKRGDTKPRGRKRISVGGKSVIVPTDRYSPGQWHRWYTANARNRRQLLAWKRMGTSPTRIDPRRADLPRWSVP